MRDPETGLFFYAEIAERTVASEVREAADFAVA